MYQVVSILILMFVLGTANVFSIQPLPKELISFSSQAGLQMLQRNGHIVTIKLLAQYTTQKTLTYCSVASAVMVLNAIDHDTPLDKHHSTFHYYTQDNFFNKGVSSIISQKEVEKQGMNLMQLNQCIQQFGLRSQAYHANEMTLSQFRDKVRYALTHQNYVIVNFLRKGLKQKGDGHFSPIAAYDERSDRFLVLDVARYKYPAFWVKTQDLWQAIHTQDGKRYRGFIIITSSLLQT